MRQILKGATDQSVIIRIVDSGDGTPETGVTSATSGLDLKYRREGAATANLTESDLSALTDAHADGGMLHIGAGYYRVDVPDAAFATGANGVVMFGSVTGMVVIGTYVHLVDYDPQNAVRLGLTALPNAAAEASGGLATLSAAQASNGTIQANVHRWLTGTPNALQSGRVDSYIGAVAAGVIAAASFAANALDAVWSTATRLLTAGTNIVLAKGTGVTGFNDLSAAQVNTEADTALADVGVTTTVTGRIDAAITTRASASALSTAQTSIDDLPTNAELATALGTADDAVLTQVALVKAKTDNLPSDPADQSLIIAATDALVTLINDLPTNSELATALAAADDAVLAAIAALNNLSAAQVTAAVPTATQNADALLKRDFSAVTGEATRSAINALRFLRNRWSIIGGTLEVTKEDDTTAAWTAAVTQTAGDPVSAVDPA